MQLTEQLPRNSLGWMLAAVVVAVLPHYSRLPIWLLALTTVCLAIRVLIFQGRISYPRVTTKLVFLSIAIGGWVFTYQERLLGVELAVALLVIGFGLKLLEMKARKDIYFVLYLCYFIVIAEFLYSQSIPIAIYMGFALLVITTALVAMHIDALFYRQGLMVKYALRLLLQSIPIMLILFVLLPRISPLWQSSLNSLAGETGVSDVMTPGDIELLMSSAETAFRVEFDGEIPLNDSLYWRGITLEDFDGSTWSRHVPNAAGSNGPRAAYRLARQQANSIWSEIEPLSSPVQYSIVLEATQQPWLFSLKIPEQVADEQVLTANFQVQHEGNISQRYNYTLRSNLQSNLEKDLDRRQRRINLSLPANGNQRARVLAVQLFSEAGDRETYVENVLSLYREQEFYYSLTPTLVEQNPVDEFLFTSREGFCEHFASSFVFLMRAAGIPARVIVGYQGGEYNPYENYLLVRQFDAHAWAEIWLEDQGWVRVDPTAAVAPDRIQLGSEALLRDEEAFLIDELFTMLYFSDSPLLSQLRLRLDAINYRWFIWVLNYDEELQRLFLGRFFGELSNSLLLLLVLFSTALVVGLVAFFSNSKAENKLDPATRIYLGFCRHLALKGYERKSGEGPVSYSQRVAKERPHWKRALENITGIYSVLMYERSTISSKDLKKVLKEFKQSTRQFKTSI